jgi:hypothetical protein
MKSVTNGVIRNEAQGDGQIYLASDPGSILLLHGSHILGVCVVVRPTCGD